MSMAATGAAVGGFLVTPIIAWIVLNDSWRTAAIISGVTMLVVGLPLAFMVRKPVGDEAAPEERRVGDAPGAQAPGELAHPSGDANGATPTTFDGDFTVKEAMRTRIFWVLALAIGMRLMAQSALTVHFVPMLVSRGVGEGTAAILVSVMAVARLPAVIIGGLVADRWSRSKASAMAMVLGIAAAGYITVGPAGLLTGFVFAILFAGAEACNTVTWALIGEYFGRRNFGSLRGIVTLLQSIMSFLGPLVAGFIFDSTDSYRVAFIAIGVTYVFSAVLYWFMRPPAAPKRAEEALGGAAPVVADQ
jgi:MFS family permease